MKLHTILLACASMIYFSQNLVQDKDVSFDGVDLACFEVAYAKHKSLVREKKYQPLENYWIEFSYESKDQILISFDPKKDDAKPDKDGSVMIDLGGVSSKGRGYQYLIDRRTKKILRVALVP